MAKGDNITPLSTGEKASLANRCTVDSYRGCSDYVSESKQIRTHLVGSRTSIP